ncbi:hypothetical protein ACEQPO_16590 [Bacillus sp. SL00103]
MKSSSLQDVNTQIISSHYGARVIELPDSHNRTNTVIIAVKHALFI